MSIQDWLKYASQELTNAQIETPRLDSLVLLEDELQKDRSWVLANPEFNLEPRQIETLNSQLQKRSTHIPLAYIRGHAEFYGRDFLVNEHVLVPRPESEALIELLKVYVITYPATHIIDIGTGSGSLAVTAKLELPGAHVHATEISRQALEVAKANANSLEATIHFHEGNLLQPALTHMHNKSYALLCNLPYVPTHYKVNSAAQNEPSLALYGGEDGLDLFRELFAQIDSAKNKPTFIITEALPEQHAELSQLALHHDYKPQTVEDFAQLFVDQN